MHLSVDEDPMKFRMAKQANAPGIHYRSPAIRSEANGRCRRKIQQQDADEQKRRARDGARRYRLGGDEAEQQDFQNRYGDHQRISDAEFDACRSQRIERKACPFAPISARRKSNGRPAKPSISTSV